MRFFTIVALLALTHLLNAESGNQDYAKEIKVTPLLQTTTTTAGQNIEYPTTDKPKVTTLLVEIPPGKETGWHIHRMPCYAYILSGSVTVEAEGGKRTTFSEGQAFAEMVNIPHNGRNNGSTPVKIIMTATGAAGVPVSERTARK